MIDRNKKVRDTSLNVIGEILWFAFAIWSTIIKTNLHFKRKWIYPKRKKGNQRALS